jgi:hypothetical protein
VYNPADRNAIRAHAAHLRAVSAGLLSPAVRAQTASREARRAVARAVAAGQAWRAHVARGGDCSAALWLCTHCGILSAPDALETSAGQLVTAPDRPRLPGEASCGWLPLAPAVCPRCAEAPGAPAAQRAADLVCQAFAEFEAALADVADECGTDEARARARDHALASAVARAAGELSPAELRALVSELRRLGRGLGASLPPARVDRGGEHLRPALRPGRRG